MRILHLCGIALCAAITMPAAAQVPGQLQSQTSQQQTKPLTPLESILMLNRIDPLQNPLLIRGSHLFDHTLTSRKNRALGEVRDILMDEEGIINILHVDFNERKLGKNRFLDLSTLTVEPQNISYRINFDQKQLIEILPDILTEAKGAHILRLSEIMGAEVRDNKGVFIASIKDVLFNDKGMQITAFALEDADERMTAVPFEALIMQPRKTRRTRASFVLSSDYVTETLKNFKAQD